MTAAAAMEQELPRWASARDVYSDGPLERCIAPLLKALGWRGDDAQIFEAMPHLTTLRSVNDLRLVLHQMGYRSSVDTIAAAALSDDLLPAIHIDEDLPKLVLSRAQDGSLLIFDPMLRTERWVRPTGRLRLCTVRAQLAAERADVQERGWFRAALFNIAGDVAHILGLSFFVNLLVLAPPLFTMAVYNFVLPSYRLEMLGGVAAVALLAVALELQLRRKRARVLATATARLSNAVSTTSLAKVLRLPFSMLDRSSVSQQIIWLRQFDSVTGAFNGTVASALCDMPFTLLLLLVVGLIGGVMVLPIIVTLILIAATALLLGPVSARAAKQASNAKSVYLSLLREMLASIENVRAAGAEQAWRGRLRQAHREWIRSRTRSTHIDALRQYANAFLMALCAIATLATGALLVIEQELSLGALVAITMLGPRVFGPYTTILSRMQAFATARNAAKRFEQLLTMGGSEAAEAAPPVVRRFEGGLTFQEMSFRYPNHSAFSLRGVDAKLEPGQIMGVVGAAGAGKALLLKLALGLYHPTSGAVLIDNVNINQLNSAELRAAVAYMPLEPDFFYGTLAQNMRLAAPLATDAEIEAILEECGIKLGEGAFQDGLHTRLSAGGYAALPMPLRQRLSLARTLVKNAPLNLLYAGSPQVNALSAPLLIETVKTRAGRQSFLIASNSKPILQNCELIMALADGRMAGVKSAAQAFNAPPQAQRAAR